MEPIDYLRVLRRRWRLILACIVAATAAMYATAPAHANTSTKYDATATLLAGTSGSTISTGVTTISPNVLQFLVTTGAVPVAAAKKLHYTGNPAALAATVEASADPNTNALTITASGRNGPRAAAVANAFANAIVDFVRQQGETQQRQRIADEQQVVNSLEAKVKHLEATGGSDPVSKAQRAAATSQYSAALQTLQQTIATGPATIPLYVLQNATPVPASSGGFAAPSSQTSRALIGAGIGLVLGCILALALWRLDTRIRNRATLEASLRAPVLAEIPPLRGRARRHHETVVQTDPLSSVADAYRALRSALLLMPSRPIAAVGVPDLAEVAAPNLLTSDTAHVILVTSARSGEGKTTTVANLAACFAEAGKRVMVLDCDFRNPSLHGYLDVPFGPGLSDILTASHEERLASHARPTAVEGVRLVTAGTASEIPTGLTTRMAAVFEEARSMTDVLLIDSAPMLLANDTLDLMPRVDSVLIVARDGRSVTEQVIRTSELLSRVGVPVAGAVLLASRSGQHRGTRSGYYGGRRSSDGAARMRERATSRESAGSAE